MIDPGIEALEVLPRPMTMVSASSFVAAAVVVQSACAPPKLPPASAAVDNNYASPMQDH
jgi:predicted lipoprotein